MLQLGNIWQWMSSGSLESLDSNRIWKRDVDQIRFLGVTATQTKSEEHDNFDA